MTVDVRNSKNERAERTRRSRVLTTLSPRSPHIRSSLIARARLRGGSRGVALAVGFANPPYGDLNDDGVIGAQDLAVLLDRWGPLY